LICVGGFFYRVAFYNQPFVNNMIKSGKKLTFEILLINFECYINHIMNKLFSILFISLVLSYAAISQDKPGNTQPDYPFQWGNGAVKVLKNTVSMGNIDINSVRIDTVKIKNVSKTKIKLTYKDLPAYLKLVNAPATLKPGKEGIIVTTYTPKLHKNKEGMQQWGSTTFSVFVVVNGDTTTYKQNALNFNCSLDEDFTKYTKKQLEEAPIVKFDTLVYDFGSVEQGAKITYDFTFKNLGRNDLEIRRVKGS